MRPYPPIGSSAIISAKRESITARLPIGKLSWNFPAFPSPHLWGHLGKCPLRCTRCLGVGKYDQRVLQSSWCKGSSPCLILGSIRRLQMVPCLPCLPEPEGRLPLMQTTFFSWVQYVELSKAPCSLRFPTLQGRFARWAGLGHGNLHNRLRCNKLAVPSK